jgi:SAM-dependent methyltransferase
MVLKWMDVSDLSFNGLTLLETVQLSWMPGWLPEPELAVALRANPAVEWFMRHKCPNISPWLDQVLARPLNPEIDIRSSELAVLRSLVDLLVYALDPAVYDAQAFTGWDDRELLELADFRDKLVLDIGAGTGRLALTVAPLARSVFAVEPVGNLRVYLKTKARQQGLKNLYAVDGLITDIPFPDGFADVVMGGHVFGEFLAEELAELERVVCPGGQILLVPASSAHGDDPNHAFLTAHGFAWDEFEEPGDGLKRKYWKTRD